MKRVPGLALFASLTVLAAGCETKTEASPPTTATPTPTVSSDAAPSPSTPEPTPSFSWDGATRTLVYGAITIAATPTDKGVRTVARVTNTGNDEAAYQIEVSIKGADGGISSHRFWFQSVPPGGTGEEEATLAATSGTSDFGKPKIYLDDVRRIT